MPYRQHRLLAGVYDNLDGRGMRTALQRSKQVFLPYDQRRQRGDVNRQVDLPLDLCPNPAEAMSHRT